ncbi:hypothetical protein J2857_003629 [Neorhizobium galegae]|uniref:hypothetical protein n=1 Tax=Neorhizobium galegae TaxID=399 RepID=UPI001AE954F1|nr:hypothetical protein [Neorhizobium galegae]MBP2560860.1 hypothetical protein [Neorhizobium galegae]
MKYKAPYGNPDPNAAYVDRNTAAAVRGSVPPAAAIEHPQREIMAVITAAGLPPSDVDLTQLLQAINALIAAATGGEGDPNYVLMTQARGRLPIFPEVLTADGRLEVTQPSTGTVRVLPSYDFLHRGIYAVTTVQTDFATAANKTYHLRWTPGSGLALKDLADGAYNAGALAEGHVGFDSSFDDMLIARIVTNASNVATITKLANKATLALDQLLHATNLRPSDSNPTFADCVHVMNWARRPTSHSYYPAKFVNNADRPDSDYMLMALTVGTPPQLSISDVPAIDLDRYRLSSTVACDYTQDLWMHFSARS